MRTGSKRRPWPLVTGLAAVLAATATAATLHAVTGQSGATVRVIDGDTIAIGEETIRIENIDAPEMPGRADCQAEADLAMRAKAELSRIVTGVTVTLRRNQTRPRDQYGRTLAVVLADGRDVAEPLIAAGLVRPWRGRSSDWCAG